MLKVTINYFISVLLSIVYLFSNQPDTPLPPSSGQSELLPIDTLKIKSKSTIAPQEEPSLKRIAEDNNYIITTNLITLVDFYNINFSKKFDDDSMLGVELRIPVPDNISGIGLIGEYRYYILETAPKWLYFGARFAYYWLYQSTEQKNTPLYSFGGVLGWQAFIGSRFNFGIGFGLEYFTSPELSKMADAGQLGRYNSTTLPLLKVELGWAF